MKRSGLRKRSLWICASQARQISASILSIFLKKRNLMRPQLFEISEQLPQMGNVIILNITISTGLFPVVID